MDAGLGTVAVGVVVGNPVADEVRRNGGLVRHVCGGTATYASLALRALGLDVALVGSTGRDHDDMLRAPLVTAGVDLRYLGMTDRGPSSAYLLDYVGSPPIRSVRLQHRGPVLQPQDVPRLPFGTAFVHVGEVAGEILPQAIRLLASWARPMGIDLHALRRFSEDGTVTLGSAAESGIDFGHFDTVKGSVEEIRAFDPAAPDLEASLRAITGLGVRHVFATDGGCGALMMTTEGIVPIPAFPVEEVDATGAGDVFLAGFLFASHALGEAPRDAALFGAAMASFVVEGPGASVLGDLAGVLQRRAVLNGGIHPCIHDPGTINPGNQEGVNS